MRSGVVATNHSLEGETLPPGHESSFRSQPPIFHRPPTKPAARFSWQRVPLAPVEGWLALVLLAVALYSVVFSIILANWVSNSSLLLWSPAIGLVVGLIVAKMPRFPQSILHLAACLTGYWFAIWLTSVGAYHIHWLTLLGVLRVAITGGIVTGIVTTNEMIFFFYLTFLCFFLGYFGSWLIYRTHLPWLVALVYCSIMLVNLSYVKHDFLYLVIILLGSLLLLIARVQMSAQVLQWTQEGLYTDRSWLRGMIGRCMQVACVLTLLALLLSWILPIQGQSASGKSLWNQIDNAMNNLVNGHVSLQNLGTIVQPYQADTNFFGDQLTITGSIHLPVGEVLSYSSNPAGPHYLEGFTYNLFDGHTWTTSLTTSDSHPFEPNTPLLADSNRDYSQVTTTVTIVQPPTSTKYYLFGPAQPISFDVATMIYSDGTTGTWTQQSSLTKGERYQVVSAIAPSSKRMLPSMPLPNDKPALWQTDINASQLNMFYMQIPRDLSPTVSMLAKQWTTGATDTYSALKMLEIHLSDQKEFTYSVENSPIPGNVDVVDWLLQTRTGYCTYYASAMAVMGRLLGIPTRIVNGFSPGYLDMKRGVWSVTGNDAHSWVQAYFPGYGWISFDPTPGFANTGPLSSPAPKPVVTPPSTKPTPVVTPAGHKAATPPAQVPSKHASPPANVVANQNVLTDLSIGALLFSLIILMLAIVTYWWRSLYTDSTFVAGMFWRLCRIASWAGFSPKAWQTPYEYSSMLSQQFPQKAAPLRYLTELFVRDRWDAPSPYMHEQEDAKHLWFNLRGMLWGLLLSKIKKSR